MMENVIYIETRIGTLGICDNGAAITQVFFGKLLGSETSETPLGCKAADALREYFAGQRQFFDLPLAPKGTPFQQKVWQALCRIPYGETRSYKEIAIEIGNPKACRAVGMANHCNPIGIIIPCHRVVGADGSLTGYAGGVGIKECLLNLEKEYCSR